MRPPTRGAFAFLLASAAGLMPFISCGGSSSGSPSVPSEAGPDVTVEAGPDVSVADVSMESSSVDTSTDAPLPPDAGTVTIQRDAGTPRSPHAFGHNYWDWVDWSDGGVTGLTGTQTLVGALRLDVIRAGGSNNDTNSPQPFDEAQIDAFVAYCRTVGAEPILQVPLIANNIDAGASSPQTAADMVTYANVTKGYGIQYWEIGNEPDLYARTFDAGVPLTATDYCDTFHAYAAAMMAANAAGADGGTPIHFLGPELAYQYMPGFDFLTPFLDGCKDVTDVVAIHRYPFSAATVSAEGVLADGDNFRATLATVRNIVANHARPGTPLAVTESNDSYDYQSSLYTEAGAAAGPGSFLDALWAADSVGIALENNLWTLAFWNIGEQSAQNSILGFIVGDKPVPPYYGQQLLSSHFRGDVIVPSGVPVGFSVYANHDPASAATYVAVINKNAAPRSLTFVFGGAAHVAFGFPGLSLSLVEIPDAPSGATHVWQYTADMTAPQQVQ
jgi:hypothetical protein